MKYVLDTNTTSYLMRGDSKVCRQLTSKERTDVLLPQPVIAEIEYGLARLPDSARKRRLRGRFEIFLKEFKRAVWTDKVSQSFGEAKAKLERRGVGIEDFDVAIAAHALATKATLVSENLSHMSRIPGLRLVNWRQP